MSKNIHTVVIGQKMPDTAIAVMLRAKLDVLPNMTIYDMADCMQSFKCDIIDSYRNRSGGYFVFVFKDQSYIKIIFTGSARVNFELGYAQRKASESH